MWNSSRRLLPYLTMLGPLFLPACQKSPASRLPPATIEFCIADTVPVAGWKKVTILETNETIYLNPTPVITGRDFAEVKAAEQRWGPDRPVREGQLAIRFTCTPEGGAKLQTATAANLRKRLAIVVNGRAIMAPVIMASIGESGELTGSFGVDERMHLIDLFERSMESR